MRAARPNHFFGTKRRAAPKWRERVVADEAAMQNARATVDDDDAAA